MLSGGPPWAVSYRIQATAWACVANRSFPQLLHFLGLLTIGVRPIRVDTLAQRVDLRLVRSGDRQVRHLRDLPVIPLLLALEALVRVLVDLHPVQQGNRSVDPVLPAPSPAVQAAVADPRLIPVIPDAHFRETHRRRAVRDCEPLLTHSRSIPMHHRCPSTARSC